MSNIKPLDNRLLVKRDETKETTDSGIVLTATEQVKQSTGIVLEIGDKVESLSIGDRVVFPDYSGTIVVTEGEENLILRETEIMAIIEEYNERH
tara:strand:+ start:273 stop:554 length:282 start_codon:yes stop_codon:yes gene_type:complete